jgi:hypothetical protein
MARIRTIKPEFWKSESIAALRKEARLTFIGLWSYVDDNGVGVDNPKLVAAELYPLEDDPRETIATVTRELDELSNAGRITRYTVGNRRYLHVTNWTDHQRIDRPGKSRHPLPSHPSATTVTSGNPESSRDSRETLANDHRALDESHLSEQGTGSREEGSGNRDSAAPATPRTRQPPAPTYDHNTDPDFAKFWDVVAVKGGKQPAYTAWLKAIKKPGITPGLLIEHMASYAEWVHSTRQDKPKWPQGWLTDERWNDQLAYPGRQHLGFDDPDDWGAGL